MAETPGILGLTDRVREEIRRHVFDNPDREVGGVLVGQRVGERAAQVMGMIPALEAVGQATAVTFTHNAWELVHRELDRRFPEMQIVGWYHSHPGFGIFLSRDDLFIHESFFSKPWQFAYVIDPIGLEEGEFGWSGESVVLIQTRPIAAPAGFRAPQAKARQTISTPADAPASASWPAQDDDLVVTSGRGPGRYPLAGVLAPLAIGGVLGFLIAPALGLGDEASGGPAAAVRQGAAKASPGETVSRTHPREAESRRRPQPAPIEEIPPPPPVARARGPVSKEIPEVEAPEAEAPAPAPEVETAEPSPGGEAGGIAAPEGSGPESHFNDD